MPSSVKPHKTPSRFCLRAHRGGVHLGGWLLGRSLAVIERRDLATLSEQRTVPLRSGSRAPRQSPNRCVTIMQSSESQGQAVAIPTPQSLLHGAPRMSHNVPTSRNTQKGCTSQRHSGDPRTRTHPKHDTRTDTQRVHIATTWPPSSPILRTSQTPST